LKGKLSQGSSMMAVNENGVLDESDHAGDDYGIMIA